MLCTSHATPASAGMSPSRPRTNASASASTARRARSRRTRAVSVGRERALRQVDGFWGTSTACRHCQPEGAVPVAGQPHHCVLRRRKTQDGFRSRRTSPGVVRGNRAGRRWRLLEHRQCHSVRQRKTRLDARQCRRGLVLASGKVDPSCVYNGPSFLSDGDHFFYFGGSGSGRASQGVYLATLEEPTGRKLLADPSNVVYAPPLARGGRAHLLFVRENTLMGQRFDERSRQLVGDPFTVAPGGSFSFDAPQVAASVSKDGTLAYLSGPSRDTQLTWVDRTGKVVGTVGPAADQSNVVLSPDGRSVLINRRMRGDSPALWLHDLVRNSDSRLTAAGASAPARSASCTKPTRPGPGTCRTGRATGARLCTRRSIRKRRPTSATCR